jgi:hypothetical protein
MEVLVILYYGKKAFMLKSHCHKKKLVYVFVYIYIYIYIYIHWFTSKIL